jgi:hypothetical protein
LLIEAEKIKEQEEEENQKEVLFKQQLDLMSTQMSTQTQQIQRLSHLLETKEQEANTNQTISAQIMISMAQQSTSQAISELKTEMSTLRILLDNQKNKSHSPHNSNIMPFIEASATTTCTPTATSSSSKNVSRNTNTTTTMTLPVPQVSNLTTKIDRLEKALVIVQEKVSVEFYITSKGGIFTYSLVELDRSASTSSECSHHVCQKLG